MYDNLKVLQLSQAMARHATARQAVAAENMAHTDTPGYKSRDLMKFPEMIRQNSAQFGLRASRADHLHGTMDGAMPEAIPDEGAVGDPNGNTVSLETEMMRGVDIRRQHDRALAIYRSSLNILRGSLGRK
ncbi:FlgB family protein [Marinovum sp. 2_MG-2023]|uniref:FlgB family protein n=1 Tax=unclassified Marinovum TaxID=2647166 RepID=UPI0026E2795A|nr:MULTISPECIES: FlgB family protein [unclassified Marinovum]MDO6729752.1 FlgB family protein [Marinovum sp. 2_MG-2023]MDO6779566.1 FlgB family protein [Marinovum sp. 1_MG-2023]